MRISSLAAVLAATLLVLPTLGPAKTKPKSKPAVHRVAFDVAINDPISFKVLIKNIDSLKAALAPEAVQVRVVCYAKGLDLMLSEDPEVVSGIERLAAQGVTFAACGITAKSRNLAQAQLGAACTLVDGGLAELVRLQESGWSYVKLGAYSGLP